MRITGMNPALKYMDSVQSKKDGQGGGNGSQYHGNQKQKDSEKEGPSFAEITDQAVSAAVELFQSDNQAKATGLVAEAEGHGPGLKVILKDRNGAVVRQFTGEEFLKMRQAVSSDGRVRGKILDQKL